MLDRSKEFSKAPRVIGYPDLHSRRSTFKTRMHTAEIVAGKMKRNSGFEMGKLFAESIRQPRQTAHLHSHREVLTFHKRCADVFGIRIGFKLFQHGGVRATGGAGEHWIIRRYARGAEFLKDGDQLLRHRYFPFLSVLRLESPLRFRGDAHSGYGGNQRCAK